MKTPLHFLLGAGALSLLAACSSSPPRSEPAPRPSGEPADVATLNLMIDDAAQYISTELPGQPLVKQSDHQQLLAVAPIKVSGFREPERFVSALESIQGKLMESRAITDSFVVINTTTTDADSILATVTGSTTITDPRRRTASTSAAYRPEDVFTLSGDFFQAESGNGGKDYRLLVKVNHPQSRRQLLSREFRRTFVWDGTQGRWTPAHD